MKTAFLIQATAMIMNHGVVGNNLSTIYTYGLGNHTITGMCANNSNPTEDVTCPADFVLIPDKKGADKMACCRRCLVLPFEASVATCTACNASSCTAAVCAKGYTGYNASTQKCTASIPVPTSASSCHTTARLLGGKCVCSSGYYWEHGSNSSCVVRTDCGAFAQGQVVSSTQDTMCEFRMTTVSWMLVALLALPSCGYALFRRRRQRRQRLAVRQQSPARRFAPSRQVRSVATLRNVLRELGVTETLPPPHRRRPIPRDRVKLPPLKKAPGTAPIIYL